MYEAEERPFGGVLTAVFLGLILGGLIYSEPGREPEGLIAKPSGAFWINNEVLGETKPESESEPEPEIVAEVNPEEPVPAEKEGDIRYDYWKTLRCKVTAYTPGEESCGKFTDGKTSTGRNAWHVSGVAADPTALPYGTVVEIPGMGLRLVDDTGSAMREAWKKDRLVHIDLRFNSTEEAMQWGVRTLNVHVYRKPDPH